jgi:hypothetical protein
VAQAQPAVVVRPPSLPQGWRVSPPPGLGNGMLGLAAMVAGAYLASTRLQEGRPVPGVPQALRVLRWALLSLAGATAAAGRAMQRALEPPAPPPTRLLRRRRAVGPRDVPGTALVDDHPDYANAAAALAARQAAAEEAAYLAAAAAPAAPASAAGAPDVPGAKPRRLSEEELQQRIAVMKGEVSPRTPVPQVGTTQCDRRFCFVLWGCGAATRVGGGGGCNHLLLSHGTELPARFCCRCPRSGLRLASCLWACRSPRATPSPAASMVSGVQRWRRFEWALPGSLPSLEQCFQLRPSPVLP